VSAGQDYGRPNPIKANYGVQSVAHLEQFEFIATLKAAFPGFFTAARTLEIGSLDINGSVRQFFDGGSYIGLDVAPGHGVDIVCPGQDTASTP